VATPRPFGVGPYGTGPYSVYAEGGTVYLVSGLSGIAFDALATLRLTVQFRAASGITFDAWALRPDLTFTASAVSGIVFSLLAPLEFTWPGRAPCEIGGWAPTDGCEDGAWQPTTGCGAGTWGETRLETLP